MQGNQCRYEVKVRFENSNFSTKKVKKFTKLAVKRNSDPNLPKAISPDVAWFQKRGHRRKANARMAEVSDRRATSSQNPVHPEQATLPPRAL